MNYLVHGLTNSGGEESQCTPPLYTTLLANMQPMLHPVPVCGMELVDVVESRSHNYSFCYLISRSSF